MSTTSSDTEDTVDNGYPFRDDIINFTIVYKKKKYFFEFPILLDRSFVLREIKERTGVRRTFCLYWRKPEEDSKALKFSKGKKTVKKDHNKEEEEKSLQEQSQAGSTSRDNQKSEVYLHSSYLTTLSLRRFSGQTLEIREGDAMMPGGDPSWMYYSQDPVAEFNRKLIQARLQPIDCPP